MIIIAEIGWNHLGDMNLAAEMIKQAASSGATHAKFQSWSASKLKPGPWDKDGRVEIYKQAELSRGDHEFLIEECKHNNIKFLSSVFSIRDAELLVSLGIKEVKIPSFESRNYNLIEFCDRNFDTVFMSTGTSTLSEVKESVTYLKSCNFYLLHCVSVYPGSYERANLGKMLQLRSIHNQVGYSDHIEGVDSAKIASGFDIKVLEKHFTIDRNLPGRDNKFAILPSELKDLTDFLEKKSLMLSNYTPGYYEGERESRNLYTGRFDG